MEGNGGVLGTGAVLGTSVVLAAMVWGMVAVPLGMLVSPSLAQMAATAVAVVVWLLGGVGARSSGAFTLRAAGYLLAMGVVTAVFLGTVFLFGIGLAVFAPSGLADVAVGGVTLALAGLCVGGFLAAVWAMDERTSWALHLRMTVSVVALALCLIALVAGTWGVVFVASTLVTTTTEAFYWATIWMGVPMAAAGWLEYRQILSVEKRADATPVTEAEYPELYARARRIAAQLDVPEPSVAVADRPTPEAMVVGFRPANTHLVCSTGLLAALDDDELDAVLAHELAHVANRDAAVMTVVSAPVVLADALLARFDSTHVAEAVDDRMLDTGGLSYEELYGEDGEWAPSGSDPQPTVDNSFLVLFKPFFYVMGRVGRAIVAVLSRARETAADRTAVQVTGSPAALASALERIDDAIAATPERDLRATAGVSTLSILPLEGITDPEAELDQRPIPRLKRRLFRTHPPTGRRIALLRELAKQQDGESGDA